MSSTPPDADGEAPKSPKHLAFVIDFGNTKSYDTQRHKALIEKFQNRHKRGQSLTKLDESPQTGTTSSKQHPSSGSLPRKNSFQSEGYHSCDERGDHVKNSNTISKNVQYSRLRADLKLPLKNINSDKMTQSFPNGSIMLSSIKCPELELENVSSPELDVVSPFSPVRQLSPQKKEKKVLHALPSLERAWSKELETNANGDKFVDGLDYDFDKSDTPSETASETGTYTLDTEKYTEEQKARMSIDHDFNIEKISGKKRTEEYVQSLCKKEKNIENLTVPKTLNLDQNKFIPNANMKQSESLVFSKSIHDQKIKIVSPILSPIQNFSIIDKLVGSNSESFQKNKGQTNIDSDFDKGCFISVTASGAFDRKNNTKDINCKTGLTKTHIETQMYIAAGYKINNLVQAAESQKSESTSKTTTNDGISADLANRYFTLPPAIGGNSGKSSPSKIPSPVHSTYRPRSRNGTVDSDSSLETESFLRPTQNYINSLQKRLSLDSTHDADIQKLNLKLNNELQKAAHIRHNSFDDKNLQTANKLEHFQSKNLQAIDQTYIIKFNQLSNPVHKINNSPNNSPVRRSTSFTNNKNQIANIQKKVTNLTVSSPKNNNVRSSPKLDQSKCAQTDYAVKSYLLRINSPAASDHTRGINQFGDTESSSEEDFERNISRKKDLSALTSTRYNRAFALRRGRLDEPPVPKCPNTPEMRRKFQTSDHLHQERAVSMDRRPVKTNNVSSRYLQSATKTKTVEKIEQPKTVPKYLNEKSQTLARTDSGRFSMRSSKPAPNKQKNTIKESGAKKVSSCRSNSSLSSREVDFQNWKRRKSYDPMKAAAEGKKKIELAKKQCQSSMTQSYNENQQSQDCDSSPSHSSSVHRSQSFHGTAALAQLISSEEDDDLTLSADEGFSPPAPSPYKLSPARMVSRQAWRNRMLD